jgi:hypothetical protein
VVGINFEVLDLLLTVKHLPAFYAEDFPVGFHFNDVQPVDESVPLAGVPFDHNFYYIL